VAGKSNSSRSKIISLDVTSIRIIPSSTPGPSNSMTLITLIKSRYLLCLFSLSLKSSALPKIIWILFFPKRVRLLLLTSKTIWTFSVRQCLSATISSLLIINIPKARFMKSLKNPILKKIINRTMSLSISRRLSNLIPKVMMQFKWN
jgi:hypothetical protein